MQKYAIIDLGSNSARLHIYHIKLDGSYYLLESVKEKVRLSEGMGETDWIQQEPLNRTIQTLKLFTSLISAHKIQAVFPLATAAIRNSKNQREVLEIIKGETGLDFQVLTGEKEAYYDYVGVINTIDESEFVLLDIGGGSTEIVWVENRLSKKAISIPFGSVNLTEKYIKPLGYEAGMKKIEKVLKQELSAISWLKEIKGLPVIGLGGAIRTFAKVDRNLNEFPIYTVHNYRMDDQEVEKAFRIILGFEPKDIDHLPGVGKKRSDIIQGGLMPLKVLFEMLKSKSLIISENGLREGYFYKCLAEKRGLKEVVFPSVLEESLNNHRIRLKINQAHSEDVLQTVTVLFDALKAVGNFDARDFRSLRVAALLHDMGLVIDYDMHHKHGFYMMMHMNLYGLNNRELTAAAYLIGKHRTVEAKLNMPEYDILIENFQTQSFEKYVCLLQIAEQLDRSESGRLKVLAASIVGKKLKILYAAQEDVALELMYAAQSASAFSKQFGLNLEFTK